jgi:hypothetical protein
MPATVLAGGARSTEVDQPVGVDAMNPERFVVGVAGGDGAVVTQHGVCQGGRDVMDLMVGNVSLYTHLGAVMRSR